MIQCSIKLHTNDGAEAIQTFEFHPELLASPATKLSFDEAFQTVVSKAIAIKLDTYPAIPKIGLKTIASIAEITIMLEGLAAFVQKEINSPIQITRLNTKTGWMIVIEGIK